MSCFFCFNLGGGGGEEVDVLFTMFLIRKDTNNCLPEFSCTSSQSIERVNGQ